MVNEHKNINRVTINLSDTDVEFIDSLINDKKMFLSRTDCLRTLIRDFKKEMKYYKKD